MGIRADEKSTSTLNQYGYDDLVMNEVSIHFFNSWSDQSWRKSEWMYEWSVEWLLEVVDEQLVNEYVARSLRAWEINQILEQINVLITEQ